MPLGRPGGRGGRYFRTVRGEICIPSFRKSSLAIRSSPHVGFSLPMRRIRSCTCFEIHGRPGRHVRRQNRRQPARCQRIIVAGRTTTRASRHLKNRDSNAKPTRSLDRCTAASRRVRRIRRVAGAASGSPRPGRLAAGPRAVQSRPDPSLTAGRFGTARSRVDDVIFVWRTLNCANCINAEHNPFKRCRYAKTTPREGRGKARYRMRRNTHSIHLYRPASSVETVNCRACVPREDFAHLLNRAHLSFIHIDHRPA